MPRCPETLFQTRTRRGVASLAVMLVVVLAAACAGGTDEPVPTPIASYTGTLTATPGPLTPAEPAPSDLEDREEVQILRQTLTTAVWSGLMETCGSQEYLEVVDPDIASPCGRTVSDDYPYNRIGPTGFTPMDIGTQDDGSIVITVCGYDAPSLYANVYTSEIRTGDWEDKYIKKFALTSLSDEEREQVLALGRNPPDYRVRGETYTRDRCNDVDVVAQVFADWQETFAFSR